MPRIANRNTTSIKLGGLASLGVQDFAVLSAVYDGALFSISLLRTLLRHLILLMVALEKGCLGGNVRPLAQRRWDSCFGSGCMARLVGVGAALGVSGLSNP